MNIYLARPLLIFDNTQYIKRFRRTSIEYLKPFLMNYIKINFHTDKLYHQCRFGIFF
ncbi:hypothetical protein IQ31_02898 [Sphingobacterium siyangense]|uniref:Uncharacterized protein n=1 Tax=Sphingobacterium siyangense TaxID=459529 RepID=A0A562MGZ8_9SPHI|nr:hypothetical protein IQ31_02898 [Sphingobacterium siyangense]